MLKKTLIAAATAVALAGVATSTAAPAAAAPAGITDISWNGGWNGGWNSGWNGGNQWKGPKRGSHKNWKPRRRCEPIVRWKKVGYRYHRRWQPVVVGWDCHRGYRGHRGHNNWKWH
jgi:hypothetical protein